MAWNFFGFRFSKRPEINSQNTGREAFQQSMGYAPASVNGIQGFTFKNGPRATNPANIAIGPTHKLNDPLATGNAATNIELLPLSENSVGAQF